MIAHSETYQVKSPATGDEPVVQLYESVVFLLLATCPVPAQSITHSAKACHTYH